MVQSARQVGIPADPRETCKMMLSCLLDADGEDDEDQMLAALRAEMEVEGAAGAHSAKEGKTDDLL